MRIVLYHGRLSEPTGGEVNIRDWALGLRMRGHQIAIYTPVPGALANQARNVGVPVVDDPALLSDAPDVMFGGGPNEVATLLARFPETPAIQACQSWERDFWDANPCPLPQVTFHMAVSELTAEQLINEHGIPRERVRIIYNAVDASKLRKRVRALSAKPQKAVAIVKQPPEPFVSAIKSACMTRGIEVDFLGYGVDAPFDDALSIMTDYDIVIASGRAAIEGAMVGAAVICADHRGVAGLLTTSTLQRFRVSNFGRAVLNQTVSEAVFGGEIDRYDAADAGIVSERLAKDASLDKQLERLEALFSSAIEVFRARPPTIEDSRRALSAYLARHLPRVGAGEPSPRHMPYSRMLDPLTALDGKISTLSAQLESNNPQQLELLKQQVAAANDQFSSLTVELKQIKDAVSSLPEIEDFFRINRPLIRHLRPLALFIRRFS